jgi:hypothetical protein
MLVLKAQLLALCEHDVSFLKAAGETDRRLLALYGAVCLTPGHARSIVWQSSRIGQAV